jgi:predicted outer membrane repeat protein
MNTPFFNRYYKTIPCLQNSLFYLLLFCTLPFQAISQSDFEIMYTLRDDYGWGAAFGWGNTLPCPEGGENWEGVVCAESEVVSIQNTCGATKLTTAAFPVEIAGFAGGCFTTIEVKDCWTDPANPVMVNNFPASLAGVNKIGLSGNIGLTGTLADLLPDYPSSGVLGSLGLLDVSNSGLSGPIPSDFLQRRTVLMYLNQCHFSGTLPASAGDAIFSNLSGNQLEGVLPNSLVNKTGGSTEISYNKLDVVNTPPGNIDNLDPDWRNTQTVPPTDVQATPAGPHSVSVSWTPIGYTWDGGYYEVLASQSPGGPYTSYGTTAGTGGKTASGLTVTGLPGGANYMVARTFTPAHTGDFTGASNQNNRDNPNDLTSVNSEEVSLLVCPGNTLYVNDDAAGNNDGSSWTDAFNDLQDALALASTCSNVTEIWVAAGTYKPTTTADRSISFVMKNGVAIYGGFNGTETQLSNRNWAANVTTLSGDIGTLNDNSDNSYHVIFNSGLDNTAVLDGFTVTGGNADASSFPDHSGGGMHNQQSSPLVNNCTFSGNSANSRGGGIYNTSSSPSLTNCSFYQNAANTGGAVSNNSGSLVNLTDCTFRENSATGGFGGAVQNTESSPCSAVNCVFTGNTAVFGGAVSTASSSQLTNCTFQGNAATDSGGGLYSSFNSSPTLANCVFWQNTGNGKSMFNESGALQLSYTLLEENACPPGAVCGAGVIFAQDPLFVSATDLHLQACSPAINTGDDTAVPAGITTDLDGNPRFYNGAAVDMGAYEFQSTVTPTTYYADADGDGYGDPNVSQQACQPPAGFVADNTDCNDTSNTVFPGAVEIPCDNLDNNCDGNIDENRIDFDGDGFDECVDCDDSDPTVFPRPPEILPAPPVKLWPPDYNYQTFTVGEMVASGSDGCGLPLNLNGVWIQQATSDEAEDHPGTQDGNTLDDIVIAPDCQSIKLRRERMSAGNGRVYTITLAYEDAGGNISYAGFEVSVPRWPWGWYSNAVKDDVLYSANCTPGGGAAVISATTSERAMDLLPSTSDKIRPELSVFPNPFHGLTQIELNVPDATHVTVDIFDIQGRRVRRLLSRQLEAGQHQLAWDGTDAGGQALSSGLYLVRARIGEAVIIRKVSLQKM